MSTVIGVDGAPGGWLAVIWGNDVRVQLLKNIRDVLAIPCGSVGIDMPIGLPVLSGRTAEKSARQLLKHRSSCVFAVPARATIEALDASYTEACTINQENSSPRRKISKQSFALFGKIRELDMVMTRVMQRQIHEVHPEVSFAVMNGGIPLGSRKKHEAGCTERISLLLKSGFPWASLPELHYRRKDVGWDDLIDACACAWSARRIREGTAITLPEEPDTDAKGLVMSIKA
jgi:predicted RNase H-like nuclease